MEAQMQTRIEEGKSRAAERLASLSTAEQQMVVRVIANVPDVLRRTFCSPDNGKGRQYSYVATAEEFAQWTAEKL